ncbi:hypothetical protein O6H91_06G099000 [Diphasiastrum complanatum]|uniref:Uncharacterized protein n=1 Tax=Diphasiastrum complanatum TaxID=34168 RepID=A0ACC2DH73_DIPCM|nr:hypothetical protein O6H91_06G099000 [Diphasiastrum complanatum]
MYYVVVFSLQITNFVLMSFQHVYHKDCILRWLTVPNSCPFCWFEMPFDAMLNSQ